MQGTVDCGDRSQDDKVYGGVGKDASLGFAYMLLDGWLETNLRMDDTK